MKEEVRRKEKNEEERMEEGKMKDGGRMKDRGRMEGVKLVLVFVCVVAATATFPSVLLSSPHCLSCSSIPFPCFMTVWGW